MTDGRSRKPVFCLIVVSVFVTTLAPGGLAQDTRTASFHGGFQQEVQPLNEQEGDVQIRLSFRTLQDLGLLFLANSSSGYIAVLIHHGNQLRVVHTLDTNMSTVGYVNAVNGDSGKEDSSKHARAMQGWQNVELRLSNRTLHLQLEQGTSLNHTFTEPIGVQSVFFGGPESFFDPLYRHLPSPHYFVGCMGNISINHRDIFINSKRYGISTGCCIAPRYSALCLNSGITNLTFSVPSTYIATDTMTVSFRLQLSSDAGGVVLLASSQFTAWVLHMATGKLQLVANVSGLVSTLNCPGDFLVVGEWHQMDLVFSQSTMSCAVNGVSSAVSFSLVPTWPRVLLRLGGTDLPPNLVEPLEESQNAFTGCFQRLRLNGLDIDSSLFSNTTAVRIATQPTLANWTNLDSMNFSELVVIEHMDERLSTDTIMLHLPQDQFGDNLTLLYQREFEKAIHLEAVKGPLYGNLFIGDPSASVKSFEYQNLVSDEANKQVGYSHNGGENSTDVVVFRVWSGCSDQVFVDFSLVLIIAIEERDDGPRITSSQPLHLAVGTRRTITADMLRVEDPEVSDFSQIHFIVRLVAVQDSYCSSCQEEECVNCTDVGTIFRGATSLKIFTQNDVNQGIIQFQHFEAFSTAPLIVRFSAMVEGRLNGNLDASLLIFPRPGHLNLTSSPDSCLFVKEDGNALLESKHLNVVTDFEDQTPTITYDVLITPEHGVLQVWAPHYNQWLDLSSSSNYSSLSSVPISSFTQADVRAGRVRYFQSEPFNAVVLDRFKFQLRSYNLSGPNGHLCINILPEKFLIQPSITIQLLPLTVSEESGSAAVTGAVLNTTLDNVDYLAQEPDTDVDVQQLGVVYTLVEAPSYGSLEVGPVILVAGDNFTFSDIASHRLVYHHSGTEHHLDNFTFYAEASSTAYLLIKAPNLTANLTLTINITATNNYPPVVTVMENIQTPEGCWIPVTTANINVTDKDRPRAPLKIILRKLKKDEPIGMFALRSSPTQPIDHFYMQDVLDNKVIYVHWLNASAPLRYKQSIKLQHLDSYVKEPLFIEAIPLDLDVTMSLLPNSSCIATLDAEQGSLQFNFNHSMFTVSLSDDHGNDVNLIPNITISINSTTHHGQILKQTRDRFGKITLAPVSQFQLQEVDMIVYMLGNQSRDQTIDVLDLKFSYGHSTPVVLSLEVCIRPILLPLHIHISRMTLTHGGMGHITTEHLSVYSSRPGDDGSLLFHVREGPRYGSLTNTMSDSVVGILLQFTLTQLRSGAVVYDHYGNASAHEDQIRFQVCSQFDCLKEELLPILIHPMNVSVNNTRVSVLEGTKHIFSLKDFDILAPPGFTNIKVIIPITGTPQHGEVKINSSAGTIVLASYFDLMDVKRGRFYYENDGEENSHDNFEVQIEAENPNADIVQILIFMMWIDIVPVNDYSPEVVNGDKTLVVVEEGSALITTHFLSAHDYDSHNNDDDLEWILPEILPIYGYIYLDQDPGAKSLSTYNWTEGDIKSNRLYYRNTNYQKSPTGTNNMDFLIFTVSDGEKTTTANLFIDIVAVNIEQDGELSKFCLDEGESKMISYQHLHYTAVNDETLNDTDFLITIKRVPSRGQLLLDGRYVYNDFSFTQDKIGSGQLTYTHDHSNTDKDNFTLEVSVPMRKNGAKEFPFHICIRPLNDDAPIVFIHNVLFVVELEKVLINSSIMTIIDEDAQGVKDDDLIVCNLVEKLKSGRLEKQRFELYFDHTENFTKFDLESGNLWYKHLSSPDLHPDHMIFNVTDGINHQLQIYNLSIVILPLIVPVTLKTLTVTENEVADITQEELLVANDYLKTIKGVITVLEDTGPRHGNLVNSTSGQVVQSFTTDDIANRSIFYFHNGDENEVDSFMFVYVALDPVGYNRRSINETFNIIISPVDDQAPIINTNPSSLRLWAKETVLLTESQFNVTDYDTSPSRLNFTVHILYLESYVAYINDTTSFIHWFTQAELRAQRVVMVHKNGPHGTIKYNVTDDKHSAHGSVAIIADPLILECETMRWRRIEVAYLGALDVNTSNLHCITTDDIRDREITYTFPHSQLLGHFEVNSHMVTSFNSTALRDGLVRFVHTETDYWPESETLSVSASSHPASPEHDLPLVVYVQYPHPRPGSEMAVNRRLNLTEGGSHCLSASVLNARNLRYRLWLNLNSSEVPVGELEVLYKVLVGPKHGNLTRNGKSSTNFTQSDLDSTSAVCYTHDDSESNDDTISLSVQVILPNNTALPEVYPEQLLIHIISQNDQQPLLETNFEKTVVVNFTSSLLESDLHLEDGDSFPHQLIFNLKSVPSNVDLILNGSIMAANSTFSQADIDLHQVTLQPREVGSGVFQFTYTDNAYVSPEVEFTLRVEKHTLTLLFTKDITYMQSERHGTVITRENLDTHTNSLASNTVFTLVHGPMYGRIVMGDKEVRAFTQDNIYSEEVFYSPHAGAQHHSDNFTLIVANTNITLPSVHMKVRIVVWGQVKEHNSINFSDNPTELATELPRDALVLDELERAINVPPTIQLVKKPMFGHLEMRVVLRNTRKTRSSREISSFRYEELQQGWIVYVWDYAEPLTNLTVIDFVKVLVRAEGYQPGEAVISLTIKTPQGLTSPKPSALPSTMVEPSLPSGTESPSATTDDGFPVYTLVPILGIILFLVVIIVVVVVFCLTQQKHIKLKLVPSGTHHLSSPWSASPTLPPGTVMPYELDPSGILPEEEHQHSSETSSGFSEPDISFHETPTHAYPRPSPSLSGYIHPPAPPRSRMRSNVSITFSSQHSTTSELSLEDEGDHTHDIYSLSLPCYAAQTSLSSEAVAAQLPVRPASHTAVSRPCLAAEDSGGGGRVYEGEREELARQQQQRTSKLHHQQHHHHHISDQTDSECLEEEDKEEGKDEVNWTEGTVLPDISDHNLKILFHAPNPVLKKEEYWV